jgi:hypothetical protein
MQAQANPNIPRQAWDRPRAIVCGKLTDHIDMRFDCGFQRNANEAC